MITVSGRMVGMGEIRRAMRELPKAVQGNVLLSAVRKEAQSISDEMRDACVRQEPAPDMADSLGVVTLEAGPHSARVAITNRPSKPHWFFIWFHEWGTSKMAARPVVRPVWDRRAEGAMARIKDLLWKKVRAAIRANRTAPGEGGDWR